MNLYYASSFIRVFDYKAPAAEDNMLNLIANAQFLINKVKQPNRSYQQKLNIFQKGWFPAFNCMPPKLTNPCGCKNEE